MEIINSEACPKHIHFAIDIVKKANRFCTCGWLILGRLSALPIVMAMFEHYHFLASITDHRSPTCEDASASNASPHASCDIVSDFVYCLKPMILPFVSLIE